MITVEENSLATPRDLEKFLKQKHNIELRFLEFYDRDKPELVIVCYFSRWKLFWNSPSKLTRFIKYDVQEHLPDEIKFKIIATRW